MSTPGSRPDPEESAAAAPAPAPASAPTGPLRRLSVQFLELLQSRVELLSTEIETEKLRLFGALAHMLLALLLAGGALFMLSLAILIFCPAAWRAWAALCLTLIYAALATWAWRAAREQLSRPSGAFAATAAELARDRASLGG